MYHQYIYQSYQSEVELNPALSVFFSTAVSLCRISDVVTLWLSFFDDLYSWRLACAEDIICLYSGFPMLRVIKKIAEWQSRVLIEGIKPVKGATLQG